MFSGGTFALLFYKCLQLCRYLCLGHKLDPVLGVNMFPPAGIQNLTVFIPISTSSLLSRAWQQYQKTNLKPITLVKSNGLLLKIFRQF